MLAHEIGDVRAADLFLAFKQQDHIAGQAAVDLEERFDRQDLREMLPLVVGDAARKDAAVADRRLERRAVPQVERVRRLYIIVAVEQHSRRTLRLEPAAHHHRMALGRYQPCLETELVEHADQQISDLLDSDVMGADAWMPDIVDQPLQEAVAVGIDVSEDVG